MTLFSKTILIDLFTSLMVHGLLCVVNNLKCGVTMHTGYTGHLDIPLCPYMTGVLSYHYITEQSVYV